MWQRLLGWWRKRHVRPTAVVVHDYPFDEPTYAGLPDWALEQHATDVLDYLLTEYR
jgi:hypothetical protein